MCGIAGIISNEKKERNKINKMINVLNHRGQMIVKPWKNSFKFWYSKIINN